MQALEAHSEGVASAAESIHRTATQSTMDRYARSLEEERMLVDGAKRSVAALESEAAAHRRQQEVMACCFRPPVSTREYPIPAMVCCFPSASRRLQWWRLDAAMGSESGQSLEPANHATLVDGGRTV